MQSKELANSKNNFWPFSSDVHLYTGFQKLYNIHVHTLNCNMNTTLHDTQNRLEYKIKAEVK